MAADPTTTIAVAEWESVGKEVRDEEPLKCDAILTNLTERRYR